MVLRGGNTNTSYVNQSGREIPKTGILRIRAIEQLRILITVFSKRGTLNLDTCLNPLLRKKIIETILYMTRTFQFCSISH